MFMLYSTTQIPVALKGNKGKQHSGMSYMYVYTYITCRAWSQVYTTPPVMRMFHIQKEGTLMHFV